MIRVLQIVTIMNNGGLENRLMDIYRTIDKSRIQFDFYTYRNEKGYFDDEIAKMGGHVYYNETLSFLHMFLIPSKFQKFLAEHSEYKIVHCHMNSLCGLTLKGAKLSGVPVRIAHSRAATQGNTLKNAIKNMIKLSVNSVATHRFAVSKKAGVWLFGEKAVIEEKVQILPNAIECRRFEFSQKVREEIREKLGIKDESVIMHVGNFTSVKNHVFLLKIFAALKKKSTFVKLILIGRDNMGGAIQRYAQQLGIEKDVMILGERSDVPELLQAGDVFVFPSFYEGFPGAVLEAQAAGLPCVISDTITAEVCVTPLVTQMSLGLQAEVWAAEILKRRYIIRENMYSYLVKAGYDIDTLAKKMTEFYEGTLKIHNYHLEIFR